MVKCMYILVVKCLYVFLHINFDTQEKTLKQMKFQQVVL